MTSLKKLKNRCPRCREKMLIVGQWGVCPVCFVKVKRFPKSDIEPELSNFARGILVGKREAKELKKR